MTVNMTPYEKVKAARDKERPGIVEYIANLFDNFTEIAGDRAGKNDESILCGIGSFHHVPVTIIGHRKGKSTEDNLKYNFGMAGPEGYRKSLRAMKQAEKFGRPVICFIDTPGAYPGVDAENRGQAASIAENLAAVSSLKVPVISFITGEGGSGGALALACGDRVYMLENAVYSILSPEGFASILWKDASKAEKAAEVMKLTAEDLLVFGIIDGIIAEGEDMYRTLERVIVKELAELSALKTKDLLAKRYARYMNFNGRIK